MEPLIIDESHVVTPQYLARVCAVMDGEKVRLLEVCRVHGLPDSIDLDLSDRQRPAFVLRYGDSEHRLRFDVLPAGTEH